MDSTAEVLKVVGGAVFGGALTWLVARANFRRDRKHRRADLLLEAYVDWIMAIQERARDLSAKAEQLNPKSAALEEIRLRIDLLERDAKALKLLQAAQDILPVWGNVDPAKGALVAWKEFRDALQALKDHLRERHES